jgi:hypothetical protein
MDTTKLTIDEAKTLVAETLASRTGPPSLTPLPVLQSGFVI